MPETEEGRERKFTLPPREKDDDAPGIWQHISETIEDIKLRNIAFTRFCIQYCKDSFMAGKEPGLRVRREILTRLHRKSPKEGD